MDTLIERFTDSDGEVPGWIDNIKMIFDWGKRYGIIVEKAHNGELANDLTDIIPHDLIFQFIPDGPIDSLISVDESILL